MQTRQAKPRSRTNLAGCSRRPQHPLWRQRQRAVGKTNREMHIAPENDAPTARGHRPASEWMKGIVDCLFARQNRGAMSLSRLRHGTTIPIFRLFRNKMHAQKKSKG